MKPLLVLALALGLGGCSIWPDTGGGGLAEMHPEAPLADPMLQARLGCALDAVAALETASALTGQATGQVALLRLTAFRATREAHGSLPTDAGRTLDRLGRQAAALHPLVGRPPMRECT